VNRLFPLCEELQQFAGADRLSLLPSLWKMTLVASDEVIRLRGFSAFKEDVAVGAGAFLDRNARLNPMALLSNQLERAFDDFRRLQMFASYHVMVFGKYGIGYAKLHLTGKTSISTVAGRLSARSRAETRMLVSITTRITDRIQA
jgi:hypothetical protein